MQASNAMPKSATAHLREGDRGSSRGGRPSPWAELWSGASPVLDGLVAARDSSSRWWRGKVAEDPGRAILYTIRLAIQNGRDLVQSS